MTKLRYHLPHYLDNHSNCRSRPPSYRLTHWYGRLAGRHYEAQHSASDPSTRGMKSLESTTNQLWTVNTPLTASTVKPTKLLLEHVKRHALYILNWFLTNHKMLLGLPLRLFPPFLLKAYTLATPISLPLPTRNVESDKYARSWYSASSSLYVITRSPFRYT